MEWRLATEEEKAFPVIYVEGGDVEFVLFVQEHKPAMELVSMDGVWRWIISNDDGTKNIVRPLSAKTN